MIYDPIFKNKVPQFEKLCSFGFMIEKGLYVYTCPILKNQFQLVVFVNPTGAVRVQVIDLDTTDEYTLHFMESIVGGFVGQVRAECVRVLQTIADNCFETKVFKSAHANKVIQYIRDKYQHDLEYLWPKFPENAIVRRSDNQKWYAAFLVVEKRKIGLKGTDKIEILDLRIKPEEVEQIVDGKRYFLGYHMNKKHWITLCLDGSVELAAIFKRIDESYRLAQK